MKLKDILDMKEYLAERCYCEGEIYDTSGFFFDVFSPDADCEHITKCDLGDVVVACGTYDTRPQIIFIIHDGKTVEDCVRVDATEHNIEEVLKYASGKTEKMSFDEYQKGEKAKAISEIMSIADAVMI